MSEAFFALLPLFSLFDTILSPNLTSHVWVFVLLVAGGSTCYFCPVLFRLLALYNISPYLYTVFSRLLLAMSIISATFFPLLFPLLKKA